mgnify:CR=1 FL=1
MPNQDQQYTSVESQLLVFDNKYFRLKKILSLLFSLFVLVGLGGTCYYGYYHITGAINKYGSAIIWTSGKYYILGALVLLVIFIWLFINGFPPAKKTFAVKPGALDYTHKRKTISIGWADVNQLQFNLQQRRFLGINGKLKAKASLSTADGDQIKLGSDIKDSEKLLSLIRKHAYPHLFHTNNQAYHANELLNFGILSLQKELGIKYRSKTWSWEDLNRVKLHKGWLCFYQVKKRQSKRFAIEKIINLDVFLALLDIQGIEVHLGKK